MRIERTQVWVALGIALVSMAPGCARYLECNGDEEACGCEVDGDCTVSPYYRAVEDVDDCYDVTCACEVPLNDAAAGSYEASYVDVDCDYLVSGECTPCVTRYAGPATCEQGRCVRWQAASGPPEDSSAPVQP